MHQLGALPATGGREFRDRSCIDALRQRGLVLSPVHRGVGDRIEHQVGAALAHQRVEYAFLLEIHLPAGLAARQPAALGAGMDVAERRAGAMQFIPQLAIGAEQQDPHGTNSGSRSGAISSRKGRRSSFGDSRGALSIQSTARRASFQRTPASASRE